MSDKLNDKDKWLAAEYALGALNSNDRRLAENRFDTELLFRSEVEGWQNHFATFLEHVEPVTPSSDIWDHVANKIDGSQSNKQSWWSSLSFLRGYSVIASGVAAASLAALLFLPNSGLLVNPEPSVPLIATLTTSGEAPGIIARYEPQTGSLIIQTAFSDDTETRVPELWLIPDDGLARSLGLLSEEGLGDLEISDENRVLLNAGAILAVSLEPQGGAPDGKPTGPVIASGELKFL